MNKNKGKVLATLAALLVLIAVIVLVLNIDLWIVSVICFVVALILFITLFVGKKGSSTTHTAELTYKRYDPRSSNEYTWAYCELDGREFRLVIPKNVYRRDKLVPGAKYKVEYTVGKNGDPAKNGDAVSLVRID